MAGHRQTRINEELTHVLSEAVRQLKDPRIAGSVVSVTDVDCAKDLKTANVYYSFFSTKYTEKDIKAALKSAAGFLRTYLARNVNLRETPLLNFIYDNSIERGNRINKLLMEVMPEGSEDDGE
jgi:ribosome-binding factor A